MTFKTGRTDHNKISSNYMEKRLNWPIEQKQDQPNKLVITVVLINGIFSIKILEI